MFFRAPKQQPFKAHLFRMTAQAAARYGAVPHSHGGHWGNHQCAVWLCMGQRIAGVDGKRSHQNKFVSYPM